MTDRPQRQEPEPALGRLFAPSAQRNRQPILDVLSRVLPQRGLVLEIASGSGEHVVAFADGLRDLRWQPSDPDPACRRSIAAHAAAGDYPNILPALNLDVTAPDWPLTAADAIVCINMVHIAPWAASEALLAGAGRILPPGGVLYLYGPFRCEGRHTAPSNAAFDDSLRARNPDWGVRNLEDITAQAAQSGLRHDDVVAMPANNLSLIYTKD